MPSSSRGMTVSLVSVVGEGSVVLVRVRDGAGAGIVCVMVSLPPGV